VEPAERLAGERPIPGEDIPVLLAVDRAKREVDEPVSDRFNCVIAPGRMSANRFPITWTASPDSRGSSIASTSPASYVASASAITT